MEKKYIYILVIAIVVYFVFFKKSKESETQRKADEQKPKFADAIKNLSLKGLNKPFQEHITEGNEGLFREGIFTTTKTLTFNVITGNLSTKITIPANTNLYGTLTQETENSSKGLLKSKYQNKSFITPINISDLK